jgi:hypothetical protein
MPRLHGLSSRRAAALRPLLDALDAQLDRTARILADPVELPRRYDDPRDQEIAGLFSACLAYGRADVFKPLLGRVLDAMGPSPAAFVRAHARAPDPGAFPFAVYRFNRPRDLAALAAAAGDVALRHGSLGARFGALFRDEGGGPDALRPALARFARELREAPRRAPLARARPRGLLHLPPTRPGRGINAGTCTSAGWCGGRTRWTSGRGAASCLPPPSSSRSTPMSTAWRAASASPAAATRAGARRRRSPPRCVGSIPTTRSATTSRSATSA